MTHGDGGKGDAQRPTNHESFSKNFDAIFKRDDAKAEDDEFERIEREQREKPCQKESPSA